ncbi:DUF421 domain-containing protein [Aerococcus agrisoli]|uniref:DUF421 domain-containing protein n=1 Tax=Aerococcus agrisoli TaxID=2487350 RepID=A0A3N4GEX8_9LACT|nr:YetF domain-containing protein [Aerococcus agrisoli]RPA60755.1 DUF421 domain-containing protein [Aerococcus agrisoli]
MGVYNFELEGENAMVGANTSLLGGLVAATTLFIVNMIFKNWMYRIPWFSKMLEGDAHLLVYEGKVNDANLQKSKITTNDLLEAIREHGLADVAEVKMAVLEVDGNISVIAGDKR